MGGPGDSTALITHYYNNYVGMSVASATPVSIVYTADILSLGTVINWPRTADPGRLPAPPAWSQWLPSTACRLYGCACLNMYCLVYQFYQLGTEGNTQKTQPVLGVHP